MTLIRGGTTFVFLLAVNGDVLSVRAAISVMFTGTPPTDFATAARVLLLNVTPTLSDALPPDEVLLALPTCLVPRLAMPWQLPTEGSTNLQPTVIFFLTSFSRDDTSAENSGGVTVICTLPLTGAFLPSLTVKVGENVPGGAVTWPETVPVRSPLSLKLRPAGRPLAVSARGSTASASVPETLKVSRPPWATLCAAGTDSAGAVLWIVSFTGIWLFMPLASVAVR